MPHQFSLVDLQRSSSARVHILLADDFAPWRSRVRSFLQLETGWKIVSEACDGLEAVQKAAELHPDVVLLDLSMPGLNGVEATRRIRQCSPAVFTTCWGNGAVAYVLKAEMTTELVPAIRAALRTRC